MTKYMILHNAPEPAGEFMDSSSPEQRQSGIDAWMAWRDEAVKKVQFEFGMPMEAVARITPEGATNSDNQASGYSMIEAESKDPVIEVLLNHPHLDRPGATLDVFEIIPMTGL